MRRLIVGISGVALLGAAAMTGVGGASAAPAKQACVLKGVAHISPGLSTANRAFSYTFTGQFSNCKGTDSTVKSGTVTASGSGTGGCTKSTTSGTATINWNNGTNTTLTITTTGVGAALAVQAKATSGAFAGKSAKAALVFQATPTQCIGAGVSSASFTGVGEIG